MSTPPRSASGVFPRGRGHAHRESGGTSSTGFPPALHRLRTTSPALFNASPESPMTSSLDRLGVPRGRGMVLEFDAPNVAAISVGPDRDSVALANKEGLFLFSLDQPRKPPVFVKNPGEWSMADIQWNPHLARREWIAATSDRQLVIWNVDGAKEASGPPSLPQRGHNSASRNVERWYQGHTRTITDLDWSTHTPDLIATAGFDSWIHVWDMRVPNTGMQPGPLDDASLGPSDVLGNPPASFCPFGTGAPLTFFSRHDPNLLVSSHHTDLHVWDLRRPGPRALHTVRSAHRLEIRGLDWSRGPNQTLVSSGQDRAIRVWDISGSEARLVEERTLEYAPWKCRWAPAGDGFVVLPFGNNRNNLYLYPPAHGDSGAPVDPVAVLEGHEESIVDFVFRPRTSDSFDVVSWGLDETLRVWQVGSSGTPEEGAADVVEHFRSEAVELGVPQEPEEDDELTWLLEAFGCSDDEADTLGRRKFDPAARPTSSLSAEIEMVRNSYPGVRITELQTKLLVYVPSPKAPEGMFLAELDLRTTPHLVDLARTPGWDDIPQVLRKTLESTCRGLAKYYARRGGCLESLARYLVGEKEVGHQSEEETVELPKQEDRFVPFPRLSGAVFGRGAAGDKLVVFSSPVFMAAGKDFTAYAAARSALLRDIAAPNNLVDASSTVSNASSDEDESPRTRRRTRRRKRQRPPPQLALVAQTLFRDVPPLVPNLLSRIQRQRETGLARRARGRRGSIADASMIGRYSSGLIDDDGPGSMGSDPSSPVPLRMRQDMRSPTHAVGDDIPRAWVEVRSVPDAAAADAAVAQLAKMKGSSPLSLCFHNQAISLAAGKAEAARCWALAGSLVARCYPGGITRAFEGEHVSLDAHGLLVPEDRIDEGVDVDDMSSASGGFPADQSRHVHWTRVAWRSHPIARSLVANLLEALYLSRDVQNLTMLVCVLSEKLEEDDPDADVRHLEAATKEFEARFKRLSNRLLRIEQKRILANLSTTPVAPITPEPDGFPFPVVKNLDLQSPGRQSTASSARSSIIDYPMDSSSSKFGTSPSFASTLLSVFGGGGSNSDKTAVSTGRNSPELTPGVDADPLPHTAAITLPRRGPHRTTSLIAPPGSSMLSAATQLVGSPAGTSSFTTEFLPRTPGVKGRTASGIGLSDLPSQVSKMSAGPRHAHSLGLTATYSSSLPKPHFGVAPRSSVDPIGSEITARNLSMHGGRASRASSVASSKTPPPKRDRGSGKERDQQEVPPKDEPWGLKRVAAFGEFFDEETGCVGMAMRLFLLEVLTIHLANDRHLPIVLSKLAGSIELPPEPAVLGDLLGISSDLSATSRMISSLASLQTPGSPVSAGFLPERRPSSTISIREHRASIASIISDVSHAPSVITEATTTRSILGEDGSPGGPSSDGRRAEQAPLKAPTDLPLLPYPFPAKYVSAMLFYADLLYAWGMLREHAWVLKHLDPFPVASGAALESHEPLEETAVQLETVCSRCGGLHGGCDNCRSRGGRGPPLCVLCGRRVGKAQTAAPEHGLPSGEAPTMRLIGSFCAICGHGGHEACMRGWFGGASGESACPAGCGCQCLFAWL